ncbi:DUF1648 domain-containing protein [Nesterenkonia muleiensis]|uniref:DUF1648 domain-containing protein n=1 Tax=Nesterenkonia muleiensis TaxID=2282648 RepID=UPI000E70B492|nr:DUF1648 domain-containing protein [Nesterenkonia muleiensis]
MSNPAKQTRAPIPHLGRRVLWGVVVPVTVTGAAFALVRSWLPRLPDEVALHWGPGGVNRYGSVAELLWPLRGFAVTGVVVLALFTLITGRTSFIRRTVLGTAAGLSVFQAGIFVVVIVTQLDLEPGGTPASIDLGMLIALGVGLSAAALALATAGKDPRMPASGEVSGAQAELRPGERAVWIRRVSPGPKVLLWGALAAAAYTALMAFTAWISGMWFTLVLALLPVLLVATMLVWQVRIDSGGLTARSSLGWPRLHIPADEVEGSKVRQVEHPIGEFGGWGIRASVMDLSGTVGVIIRKGEALEVLRTGDRRTVITVDDAATASALLNAKAQRSRTP